MDTSNLNEKQHLLIAHLEANGYDRNYKYKIKSEIGTILRLSNARIITSYADAYTRYEKMGLTGASLRGKGTLISAIEKFDLQGLYPDGSVKQTFSQRGAYYELSGEYKAIIDCFIECSRVAKKGDTTIRRQACNASVFLLDLQHQGINRLEDALQENILSIFTNSDGSVKKGSTTTQTATFLKTCMPHYPECKKVLLLLPMFKYKRKNIKYLTSEEIQNIKNALSEEHHDLSYRDKAIGKLALYTGLRGSDIAGLTAASIDCVTDEIIIKQRKTGYPLILPLTAIVGNAIFDYVEHERPKTDCEYLFISYKRPYGRLSIGAMYDVSLAIMKAADIRKEASDRKGLHLFRHHFATSLLGNGIPRPVVCSLTGHAAPPSLDTYLSADFPHLKECAVSIEQFPVSEEVFAL